MPTHFISTNTIGAGPQFTFAANGDDLVILPNVTLGSTTGTAISSGAFSDISITVLGTLVSHTFMGLPTNSSFTLAEGATFLNFESLAGNSGLFLTNGSNFAQIDGTLSAPEAIAVLARDGSNTVNVTGSVSGASAVFLGLFGGTGDILVNSGSISANSVADLIQNTRHNNAVYTEGANTRITNLIGGTMTAISSEGNGVRIAGSNEVGGGDVAAPGTVLTNHGTITSMQAAGVFVGVMNGGETVTLINTGTIIGATASLEMHLSSLGRMDVTNHGQMIGDVILASGSDAVNNQDGHITGLVDLGAGNDTYLGRGNAWVTDGVFGGTGNDLLIGGDNDDFLFGGTADDTLYGGAGDDEIYGGSNADSIKGGAGDDLLYGDSGTDTLYGGAGHDTLFGGTADDMLYGGSGDDELYGEGSNDTLRGATGDDVLFGGSGNDLIYGGSDDDVIHAGTGSDTLYGGSGADTFVWDAVDQSPHGDLRDIVMDFEAGVDRIDLSGFGGLTFIGGAANSGAGNEVRYNASIGRLYIDLDGVPGSEFSIDLVGAPALTEADLIL